MIWGRVQHVSPAAIVKKNKLWRRSRGVTVHVSDRALMQSRTKRIHEFPPVTERQHQDPFVVVESRECSM